MPALQNESAVPEVCSAHWMLSKGGRQVDEDSPDCGGREWLKGFKSGALCALLRVLIDNDNQ